FLHFVHHFRRLFFQIFLHHRIFYFDFVGEITIFLRLFKIIAEKSTQKAIFYVIPKKFMPIFKQILR
ncbi:MAG: hypothetical protein IKW78_06120, partial [Prevotella sp.]|nr:hypothetical protein [Prevotella sp.]